MIFPQNEGQKNKNRCSSIAVALLLAAKEEEEEK